MFLVSFLFRLAAGTFKIVALVFVALICADYANQKIAEAEETLANLTWDDVKPKIEKFGSAAYSEARVQTQRLISQFSASHPGKKTSGKEGYSAKGFLSDWTGHKQSGQKEAALKKSPYRF